MTVQERFADDWQMPLGEVTRLVGLARHIGRCGEHICNGDRMDESSEPDSDKKSHNAHEWGKSQNVYESILLKLIGQYGFTGIEYCGLGPTLKRGTQFVEVPY